MRLTHVIMATALFAAAQAVPDECWAQTAPAAGDSWDTDFQEAKRSLDGGSYLRAEAKFDDLIQKYRHDQRIAEAFLTMGQSYLRNGQAHEAAQWYLKAYQIDQMGKFAPDGLLGLAQAMRATGIGGGFGWLWPSSMISLVARSLHRSVQFAKKLPLV